MTAKVVRLRPRGHDTITQALEVAAQLPLLSQPVRDEIAEALSQYQPQTSDTWRYVMLAPEQIRLVLKQINASPKPAITLRVWTAVVSHVQLETGEIMAGRSRIAEDADTSPEEASRALSRLAEMGALIRIRPGRYRMNPQVGWAGSLAKREAIAKSAPQLHLVPKGV